MHYSQNNIPQIHQWHFYSFLTHWKYPHSTTLVPKKSEETALALLFYHFFDPTFPFTRPIKLMFELGLTFYPIKSCPQANFCNNSRSWWYLVGRLTETHVKKCMYSADFFLVEVDCLEHSDGECILRTKSISQIHPLIVSVLQYGGTKKVVTGK